MTSVDELRKMLVSNLKSVVGPGVVVRKTGTVNEDRAEGIPGVVNGDAVSCAETGSDENGGVLIIYDGVECGDIIERATEELCPVEDGTDDVNGRSPVADTLGVI